MAVRKLTQIHGRIPDDENREQEAYLRAFLASYLGTVHHLKVVSFSCKVWIEILTDG